MEFYLLFLNSLLIFTSTCTKILLNCLMPGHPPLMGITCTSSSYGFLTVFQELKLKFKKYTVCFFLCFQIKALSGVFFLQHDHNMESSNWFSAIAGVIKRLVSSHHWQFRAQRDPRADNGGAETSSVSHYLGSLRMPLAQGSHVNLKETNKNFR